MVAERLVAEHGPGRSAPRPRCSATRMSTYATCGSCSRTPRPCHELGLGEVVGIERKHIAAAALRNPEVPRRAEAAIDLRDDDDRESSGDLGDDPVPILKRAVIDEHELQPRIGLRERATRPRRAHTATRGSTGRSPTPAAAFGSPPGSAAAPVAGSPAAHSRQRSRPRRVRRAGVRHARAAALTITRAPPAGARAPRAPPPARPHPSAARASR